jgi:glycosyltransferase involved in cell wall biosynthesis
MAMADLATRKLGPLGRPVGAWFQSIERRLLRRASGVVAITDDFGPILRDWGIEEYTVIENWGPRDEIAVLPRDNPWARAHGLTDARVLLYSGTLGLKHNPALLVRLAEACRDHAPDARVVVVSEGLGGDWLASQRDALGLSNLIIEPYQPYDQLPQMLATADVLLTLLEPDAGVFSVPSKILTYLCAGRAILAAMPAENLGARTLVGSGAGVVVDPNGEQAFVTEALRLLDDPDRRAQLGRAGRTYAETAFDPTAIADAFEAVLESAVHGARHPTEATTR